MYTNAYRLERNSDEVSKLRRSFIQRFNPSYKKATTPTTKTTTTPMTTTPNGIYIRNTQPKRPKSPFTKFEQNALKAESHSNQLLSASESNLVTSAKDAFGKSAPSRRQPINMSDMRHKNYTPINRLEDLVIACVNAPPVVKANNNNNNNNLIYYKKKYLFDMGESNWNLFSAETLSAKVRQEKERQCQLRKAQSQQNLHALSQEKVTAATAVASSDKPVVASRTEEKASFINAAKDLQKTSTTKQYAKVVKVESQLEPKILKDDLKINQATKDQTIADAKERQTSTLEIERKWLKSSVDTELLESYMKKLMAESVLLRKKIADGDEDLETFKKLAQILALKKKYESLRMVPKQPEVKLERKNSIRKEKSDAKVVKKSSINAEEKPVSYEKAERKSSTSLRKKSAERKSGSGSGGSKVVVEAKQHQPKKVSNAMPMDFFPFTKKVLMMREQRHGDQSHNSHSKRYPFGEGYFLNDLKRHPLVNCSQ